jgi:HSP20 family molecular chaperone IbpA
MEATSMAEKTVPSVQADASARREETREQERYITPPVDIFEIKDGLSVIADLPGVDQQGLDVRVADGVLTIEGRTKHVAPGTPFAREYELLNFYRQFELPDEVDAERISAQLRHGVLLLQLPKKEKAKPRQISVQVS